MKFCFIVILILNFLPDPCLSQVLGIERVELYFPMIKNKNIGLVVNQSSKIGEKHLIDFLKSKNFKVKRLFALEHGLRGDLDAGEEVQNGIDLQTGIPVSSLYGKNKAPMPSDLQDLDVLVFDIQDVGVRFYTYISSLFYILDACGKYQKHCIVLDRPNPFVTTVAGPVLEESQKSFVGMYSIPVIYGLTIGELASMIIGEKWLEKNPSNFSVIPISNWKRSQTYQLPVRPSPNLPRQHSILWYPSLALFEPTIMSIGRGTYYPFEVIGYPDKNFGAFSFQPQSLPGTSKHPKHQDKVCFGEDLRMINAPTFTLEYLVKYFNRYTGNDFFQSESFFNKLIGNTSTLKAIKQKKPFWEIEKSWEKDIQQYKVIREKYLIYE